MATRKSSKKAKAVKKPLKAAKTVRKTASKSARKAAKKTVAKKSPVKKAAAKKALPKKAIRKTASKPIAKKAAPRKLVKKSPVKPVIVKPVSVKSVIVKPAITKPIVRPVPIPKPIYPALVQSVLDQLDDSKAEQIVTIDLINKSTMADTMIVASGRSNRHVNAIAEQVADKLRGMGQKNLRIEGMPQCDWVLVDSGDVIIHIFRPEVRSFYNLEKLWSENAPHENR